MDEGSQQTGETVRQAPTMSKDDDGGERKVRRSTREIKRPKFDDELVESAVLSDLAKMSSPLKKRTSTDRAIHSPTVSITESVGPPSAVSPSIIEEPIGSKSGLRKRVPKADKGDDTMYEPVEEMSARMEKRRRDSRVASKDMKTKELAAASEVADTMVTEALRRWTAHDDVALLTAATHVCDLAAVFAYVRFSRVYTLSEIEERWYELMYDENLSKQAKKRMAELRPEEILRIQSLTVFTMEEERLLLTEFPIPLAQDQDPASIPKIDDMERFLRQRKSDFHPARTGQVLLDHWMILRQHDLRMGEPRALQLSAVERQTQLTSDLALEEARLGRELARCSASNGWRSVAVEPVTGIPPPNRDGHAQLRGRVMVYTLKANKVWMGRSTPRQPVEVNLALEGPALKVSRKQCVLVRDPHTRAFSITNHGRRPITVDGRVLLANNRTQLADGSLIEIAHIRLVFKNSAP